MGRALALALLACLACGGSSAQPAARPQTIPLPAVVGAPGAGNAWLTSSTGVTGVDPDSRGLGTFLHPVWNAGNESGALRSADGGRLYVVTGDGELREVSAADGQVLRAASLKAAWRSAPWVSGAISADARWVALARQGLLALVDLQNGAPVAASADIPDGVSPTLVVTPSGRVQAMLHSGELTSLTRHGDRLQADAVSTAKEIQCAAPALQRLLQDASTLFGYCPMNGEIWWFDLGSFKPSASTAVRIGNPFWGAPSFSLDGRNLVVFDSWDGYVSTVDLQLRKVVRSAKPLPSPAVGFHLPFVSDAYAKGPNYSASLAPDGATLFIVGSRSGPGILAIDTSTTAVRARWLGGQGFGAVWVGGDAQAVYAIRDNGKDLVVVNPHTGAARTIPMSGLNGFAVT